MKPLAYALSIFSIAAALVIAALAKHPSQSSAAGSPKTAAHVAATIGSRTRKPAADITVAVHPRHAPVTAKVTQQFTAVVTGGTDQTVTWYVDGKLGGNATVGTIDVTGLYTPPATFTASHHTVKAVSVEDPTKFGKAAMFWVTYAGMFTNRNDNSRTGQNLQETVLTPANVNVKTFRRLFALPVDGGINAQPLYVANVNIPAPENGSPGFYNVLYVATQHDTVFAFDADGKVTGPLWHASFINPPNVVTIPGNCLATQLREIGITATPTIDPATNTIYIEARTLENPVSSCQGAYVHRLHALDITTGQEKFGGPVVIQASVQGNGVGNVKGVVSFNSKRQNIRPGLLLSKTKLDTNNIVFLGSASLQDIFPYHGWVLGYDSQTLALKYTYNSTPDGGAGGVWQDGGGLAADSTGSVYVQTGNGSVDNENGDYGQAILKLRPINGQLGVSDFFSPADRDLTNSNDWDISSGGLLLLPRQPGAHPHLIVGGGKEGTIYVVDRDKLGHFNAGGDAIVQEIVGAIRASVPQGEDYGIWNTASYYENKVYIFGRYDFPKMFALTNGLLATTATSAGTVMMKAPNPVISANVDSNGIVWILEHDIAKLSAFDPDDLTHEFYDTNQNQSRDHPRGRVSAVTPTVANGRVYVPTSVEVEVYGLLQ